MIITRIALIRVLCCIGCFSQTFYLTNLYYSYLVKNGVTFTYPNEIILPEIHIAIPIASLLNLTAIFNLYPRLISILCYETRILERFENESIAKCDRLRDTRLVLSSIMDKMLTVGDIEKYTVDPVPMIHNIYFQKFKKRLTIGKDGNCQIKRYFSAHRIFLRIMCSNDSQPFKADKRNLLANNDFLVAFAHSFKFSFEIRLSRPNSSIKTRSGFYEPIQINPGEFIRTFLNFRKIAIHLIEPPYQTNCRHYSRFKSFDLCLKHFYLSAKGSNGSANPTLHPASLHEFGVYPSNLHFTGLDEETKELIHSKCRKAVQQSQCNTVEYHIKVKHFVDKVGSVGGLVLLSPSTEPDVLFESYPYMQKTEYIVFIGSVWSFWFGLSVSNRLFWSLNLFIRFKNRKETASVHETKVEANKVLFIRRTSYNSKCYHQIWNTKPEN